MKKLTEQEIEKKLRRLSVDKLRLLRVFTRPDRFIPTSLISTASQLSYQNLGGTISSLVRTTVNGQQIIQPVGKSKRQAILELNENIVTKKTLKDALDKIGI